MILLKLRFAIMVLEFHQKHINIYSIIIIKQTQVGLNMLERVLGWLFLKPL